MVLSTSRVRVGLLVSFSILSIFAFEPLFALLSLPSASAMAQPAFISSLRSRLRSLQPQPPLPHLQPRRGYHVDLGAREKALLEEDTALKRFKSYKNNVKQVSKVGNVLTLVVVAACSYEIFAVATK